MCGIAGIAGSGAAEHREAVRRMLDAMAHRGPEGEGLWVSPGGECVLGHRRLAILDLSEAAAQPMVANDARHVLSYNGECYNFRELRHDLEKGGYPFASSGDTEVVLALLARRGTGALAQLNAMFALALWDDREHRLLLARDRFGQKPLYWAPLGDGIVFASEVRALLASGLVERRLSREGLLGYLCQGAVQGPRTIVEGVRLLPRATSLVWQAGDEVVERPYWEPPREKRAVDDVELRDRLQAAVGRHLASDVPIGLFLSGGVDSSVIAAAAMRTAGVGVTSLAVIFPDQPDQCEAEPARRMANAAGTRHVEIPMTGGDMASLLDDAVSAMDQPTLDAVNTYIVSRAARQAGLTVALSGLGGDELFGGYPSFTDLPRLNRSLRLTNGLRGPARSLFGRGMSFTARTAKLLDLLDAPADVLSTYLVRRKLFSSRQIAALAPALDGGEWASGLVGAREAEINEQIADRPLPDAIAHLELDIYMGQVLLRDTDVMGMATSLEIRVPFLDAEFAGAVLAQAAATRIPNGVAKWRLIRAAGDWLPEDHWRRPKRGFTLPLNAWLRGALRGRVAAEIAALPQACGMFRSEPLDRLWKRFQQSPNAVGWSRPWSLFVLSEYIRRHKLAA